MNFETAYNEWLRPVEDKNNFSNVIRQKYFANFWSQIADLATRAKVKLTPQDTEMFEAGGGVTDKSYKLLLKKLPDETRQLYDDCHKFVDAEFNNLLNLEIENRVKLYQYCHTVPVTDFMGNEMMTVRCDEFGRNNKECHLHLVKHLRDLGFTVEVHCLYCNKWSSFSVYKRLITANITDPRKLLMCYPSYYPIQFDNFPNETYWYNESTKEAELIKLYYRDATAMQSSSDKYFSPDYEPEHNEWKDGWRIVKTNQ